MFSVMPHPKISEAYAEFAKEASYERIKFHTPLSILSSDEYGFVVDDMLEIQVMVRVSLETKPEGFLHDAYDEASLLKGLKRLLVTDPDQSSVGNLPLDYYIVVSENISETFCLTIGVHLASSSKRIDDKVINWCYPFA